MKLYQLNLSKFGPFQDQTVAFEPGLTLLFGHNEAGKSSLLRAVRAAFFGAGATRLGDKTVRTLDGWEGARSAAKVTVSGALDDGRALSFERTNKKRPVEGTLAEAPLDVEQLTSVIGIDGVQYRNVFGFTLDELRDGEQSLLDASVVEVLFGGGLGRLTQFRQLQKDIEKRSGELFTARGKTKQVNAKLLAVHQVERDLRERTVTPQAYLQATQEIADRERDAAKLDSELSDLRDQLNSLDILDAAQPLVEDLREQTSAQIALELSLPVPEADVQPAVDAIHHISRLTQELNDAERQLDNVEKECRQLVLTPEIEPSEELIEAMHADSSHVLGLRRQLPEQREQLEEIAEQLATHAVSSELPDDTADRLKEWREQEDERNERARQAQADLVAAKRRVHEIDELLGERNDLKRESAVLACAGRWEKCERNQEEMAKLASDVERSRGAVNSELVRLSREVGWSEWPEPLPALPTERERQTLADEFEERRTELSESSAHREAVSNELQQVEDELATLRAAPTVVTIDQLRSARGQRDEMLNQLIDEVTTQPTDRSQEQLTELKTTTQAADDVSDRMTANAQSAAREAALSQQKSNRQRDFEAAQERCETAESMLAEWDIRWEALWAPLQVNSVPTPEVAARWVESVSEVLEKTASIEHDEVQLNKRTTERDDAEKELRSIVPGDLQDAALDVCRAWLDAETTDIQDRQSARRRAEQQRPTAKIACDELTSLIDQCAAAANEYRTQFAAWLVDHKLPAELTLDQLARQLEVRDQARRLREQSKNLERAIRMSERAVSEFDDGAAQIRKFAAASSHETDTAAASSEQAVAEAYAKLQSHRTAAATEAALSKECNTLRTQRDRLQNELEGHQHVLKKIVAVRSDQLDVAESQTEFQLAVEKSAQYWKLEHRVRSARGKLEVIAKSRSVDDLVSGVDALSARERAAKRETLVDEATAKNEQRKSIFDMLAVQRNEQTSLAQVDRLGEFQSELESERAELRDAIEAYAPLVLLQGMLSRAITKFEDSVRPELLASVAQLFSQLTGGAYRDVGRSLEADKLRVLTKDKVWKSPAELSTGTRELLYLAVRLAFVRAHVREHESMPVFMDDVLVNVDAQRTVAVVQTLVELSQQMQIVLLSCRPELAMMFEQMGHADAVSEIVPGQLASARLCVAGTNTMDQVVQASGRAAREQDVVTGETPNKELLFDS